MNMKGLIAATLVVIVPASLHAQEPLIPQNFLQTAPEAYYHYEPNVLECVEWLTETPLEADSFDRRTIGKFIDTWLRETPSIRISLDPTLTAFLDDAKYFEEQMTVYTGGYAAGLLELKSENGTLGKMTLSPRGLSDEDRTAGATRAIEYSIAFYDRNRDLLGRNGKLERLKKMQERVRSANTSKRTSTARTTNNPALAASDGTGYVTEFRPGTEADDKRRHPCMGCRLPFQVLPGQGDSGTSAETGTTAPATHLRGSSDPTGLAGTRYSACIEVTSTPGAILPTRP